MPSINCDAKYSQKRIKKAKWIHGEILLIIAVSTVFR